MKKLILFLSIKSLFLIWLVNGQIIGLGPDEAQYWTWARDLDFGYYSKPPGIAWLIFLGTKFFGNSEMGVRFFAIVIGFLTPLTVYFLARVCKLKKETAFYSALIIALTPFGLAYSFLATTDPAMIIFWTLSVAVIARSFAKGEHPNYILLGFFIALGALFKWPIYLLWLFVIRKDKKLILGIIISFLGLVPSLIWNVQNGFATFKHATTAIFSEDEKISAFIQGNFFDFLGAQIALVSPILFVILIGSFWWILRNYKDVWAQILFVAGSALAILFLSSLFSIFRKVQGNWIAFIYPQLAVAIAWYACEVKNAKKWINIGLGLSIFLSIFIFAIPILQARGISIPYKYNIFHHNIGWREMEREIKNGAYNSKEHFLFSDKYQMASLLSFYSPGQRKAYFLNLQNSRKNQFSFWPSMKDLEVGNTGFFVLADNTPYLEKHLVNWEEKYQKVLSEYFEKVELLGIKPLFSIQGQMVKGAIFFKCINYNGKTPFETVKY